MSYGGYAHLDPVTGKLALNEIGSASGFLNGDVGISVNLKNVGQTSLYTVPNDKNVFLQDVLIVITALVALAVNPIIRVGKSAGYSDFVALTTLPTFLGVGNYFFLSQTALNLSRNSFLANDIIAVDVQTGATATTLTADFYPIGYLK